ncbi:hypothetical protein HMPREF1981_03614 [Bacteroides pyogenes F0041]|uniref:Uncharacterized protein n=1 Tax=Bacteroides pyogenes F0041 TaxID=1321819 RepID=U2C8G7_9BACE|nr:hypothetical protein HMPREF1981_03614 [Bacteroides pyogenes F0041]
MQGSVEACSGGGRKIIAGCGLIYPSFPLLFSPGLLTFRHR